MADAPETKPSLVSNIIALIGFIFILIIIVWGLLNIGSWVPGIGSWFSGLFGPGKTLTIELQSSSVPSGTPTTIGWTHKASDGTYAFEYECTKNASFSVPTAATSTYATLPCATPYIIAAAGPHAIKVVPTSSAASVTIPFTITYRDTKGVAGASGTSALTITNAQKDDGGTGSTGGSTSTTTPPAAGKPDLTVSVLGLGVIVNGVYQTANQINPGDTAAIRFEIRNAGTKATGAWRFRASLPTADGYIYNSALQDSLAPGSYVIYTLRFTNLAAGGGIVTIEADPQHAVAESNESNNGVSYRITVQPAYSY
ncbi:MAG TPA: CARDB domain-containing protein [Candidatus Paceibacterota bacterium]|nr:CARDB domain-containing protein [Candidatus Paceibacterota bacterium]